MENDRRRLVARTALHVLATHGSRGLTHRAVDAAASLPPGSTSYYVRTRAALLAACVDELVEQDREDMALMAPLVEAGDLRAVQDALADLVLSWVSGGRERHVARYELALEAVRRPEVAEVLHRGGQAVRSQVAAVLETLGADDAAQRASILVACVDGVIFDRVAGANAGVPVERDEVLTMVRRLTALEG